MKLRMLAVLALLAMVVLSGVGCSAFEPSHCGRCGSHQRPQMGVNVGLTFVVEEDDDRGFGNGRSAAIGASIGSLNGPPLMTPPTRMNVNTTVTQSQGQSQVQSHQDD